MLRQSKETRTLKENLLLASSTAFVSGVTNVAGMIAFLAFTSNITGHVANLAKHVVEQNWSEIVVFVIWLMMFFAGAFISNFIVHSLEHKSRYRAHSIPIVIEIILPFGGARGSGTNDKAGSMINLLRWVSPRTIKETFDPPKDYRYPFLEKEV